MRNQAADIRTEGTQAADRDRGSGDAVNVEVAKDEDALAGPDRGLDLVRDIRKTGDQIGVEPVALKRGCKEALGLGRGVDTARDEDSGSQRTKVAGDLDSLDAVLVNLGNLVCELIFFIHVPDSPTKM